MANFLFSQMPQVMDELAFVSEKNARKLLAATARHFGREVVLTTPVDVGDARSNWYLNVQTASPAKPMAYSPFPKLGSAIKTLQAGRFADIANASAAISQHNGALAAFEFSPNATALVFTNNSPYIVPLDEGRLFKPGGGTSRSLQVAPGFIDRAIDFAIARGLNEVPIIPPSSVTRVVTGRGRP